MATSKKTVSQDTSRVNLQELEKKYYEDLRKKIPFCRKHIPQLEKLDFEKLQKEAGVKFNERQRQRIFDLINNYHRDSTNWNQGVGAREAKDRMKNTTEAANKLSALLSCETPEKHAIVDHYWPFKDLSPAGFRIGLGQLAESAKTAADGLSPSRGNPGNPHIHTLVRRLHYIWTQAGGELRGSTWNGDVGLAEGPFLFFLQLLLEQAGERHSLDALHSVIRSALKA